MKFKVLVISAAVALAATGSASAFSARNGFSVQAMPGGNFQVMNRGGLSDQNAWCAAGDYAMSVLGVNPSTPIFRVSPPPRPRGANIVFSLSPVGAASSTGLATLGGSGNGSIVAVSARNMCSLVTGPGGRR